MFVPDLTPGDSEAWEDNASRIQAVIDGGGVATIPDHGEPLFCGPLSLPSDRRVKLEGYGVEIRARGVAGSTPAGVSPWLSQADNPTASVKHLVCGFSLSGDEEGVGIKLAGWWRLRDLEVSGFFAPIQLVEDHCSFYNVEARKATGGGILIGPTEAHAGGHTMIGGSISDCPAAWLLDPSARYEGWRVLGPHLTSNDWIIDRLPGQGSLPPFMMSNEWQGVRAEWTTTGVFRDASTDPRQSCIRENVFLGGGVGMTKGTAQPPAQVLDISDNEVLSSNWV